MSKLLIPQFTPRFEDIRNDRSKHLTMKKPDGSYMVEQDEIDGLARDLLDDPFYIEPWLTGCDPMTVLFPGVIEGLRSSDPDVRRDSVNAAYNAEFRVIKMGVDDFIDWCRRGRDRYELAEPSGAKSSADGYRVVQRRSSISLTKLTRDTRDAIEKIYNNKDLLNEMPANLRDRIKQAHEDIESGQLFEEFGELILEAFEQWRIGRKQISDLSRLIPEAVEQREELLINYSHSAAAMIHCGKLMVAITNPKQLQKLLKDGIAIQQKLSLPE